MMTFEKDFNSRLRWSISHYHDKQLVKGFQLVVGVIKDLTNKKCYGLTTIKLLSYLEIFNCTILHKSYSNDNILYLLYRT